MEFLRFVRVLRRRWRLVAGLVLLGAVAGFVSATVSEDADPIPVEITRYAATHTLIIDANIPEDTRTLDTRNLAQLAQRVTQGEVPATVAALLGRDESDVASRAHVSVDTNSQTMAITAYGETDAAAVEVADELAASLLAFLNAEATALYDGELQGLETRLDQAERDLAEIRQNLSSARADGNDGEVSLLQDQEDQYRSLRARADNALIAKRAEGAPIVPIETLEGASAREIGDDAYRQALLDGASGRNVDIGVTAGAADERRTSRSTGLPIPAGPMGRGLLGGGLGLFLAVAAVLVLDRIDPRLRNKDDVEMTIDLPVVAEIPPLNRRQRRQTDVMAFTAPRSRAAEAYRVLRSALEYGEASLDPTDRSRAHVVLVTSPGPSEGKTTTVANLAVVLAEADKEVLVINCDFRRPRLTDYLGGDVRAQRVNLTSVPGVHLITHVLPEEAEPTPAEVLAAQRRVIERARDRFDVILLDTAPLLTTNDAADVLSSADHVVLVVSTGKTTREAADRAVELLERRAASILGVTLIGAREVPNAREYYYDGDDPYLQRSGRRGPTRSGQRRPRRAPADAGIEVDDKTGDTTGDPAQPDHGDRIEPSGEPARS